MTPKPTQEIIHAVRTDPEVVEVAHELAGLLEDLGIDPTDPRAVRLAARHHFEIARLRARLAELVQAAGHAPDTLRD